MTLRSAERVVRLASMGVRCVEYAGHDASGVATTLSAPISGLRVEIAGQTTQPTFHGHRSVYGFTGVRSGTYSVAIHDPLGRYLSRRVEVTVDSRREDWQHALESGGAPDWSGWQPIAMAPLLPAPGNIRPGSVTVVRGTVFDAAGAPAPFARLEWAMTSGTFETHANLGGDYVAVLRDVRAVVDPVTGRLLPTVDRDVRVFALVDPLNNSPANFHELRPGTPAFAAVWTPLGSATTATLTVGTTNRFDIA